MRARMLIIDITTKVLNTKYKYEYKYYIWIWIWVLDTHDDNNDINSITNTTKW